MAQILDTDVVVRGGQSPLPVSGTVFSGSYGKTLEEAAGGAVEGEPGLTRSGILNMNHVNIWEGAAPSVFTDPFPNPIPKSGRIA